MAENQIPACCEKRGEETKEALKTAQVALKEGRNSDVVDLLFESAAKGAAHKIRDCEDETAS